ncbi:hypothetical protein [Lysobacter sp. ESA13C]|uniref:hypothetical protein n=1 Tax=Lysobacter sp. ESA13C TaxID=2862676 RepID=UPI001CBDF0E0|nr:hypothetical protein [Lysobacter sp. ESA13C]
MRDDQYLRMQALEEKLTEQFLTEADPVNWSGDGVLPKHMTQDERGDRYWCKKNAVATISLTIRIGSLLGMIQRRGETTPADGDPAAEGEGLLDAEIADAEREAKKMLTRLSRRGGAKVPSPDEP